MAANNENQIGPWYSVFGFYNSPFNIKPAYFNYGLVGYDSIINELTHKIRAGSMVFIEGPLGSGKTSILKYISYKLRKEKEIIFFSCNQLDKQIDIASLLHSRPWSFRKLFGLKPKAMALLLDEVQELSEENMERIKYFFDHDHIKSVVFAGIDYNNTNFSPSIKERIGNNVIKIPVLSFDNAVKLIRNRIGNWSLLSNEIIEELHILSNYNPRRLLHSCDEVCRQIVISGRNVAKREDVKKIKFKYWL